MKCWRLRMVPTCTPSHSKSLQLQKSPSLYKTPCTLRACSPQPAFSFWACTFQNPFNFVFAHLKTRISTQCLAAAPLGSLCSWAGCDLQTLYTRRLRRQSPSLWELRPNSCKGFACWVSSLTPLMTFLQNAGSWLRDARKMTKDRSHWSGFWAQPVKSRGLGAQPQRCKCLQAHSQKCRWSGSRSPLECNEIQGGSKPPMQLPVFKPASCTLKSCAYRNTCTLQSSATQTLCILVRRHTQEPR